MGHETEGRGRVASFGGDYGVERRAGNMAPQRGCPAGNPGGCSPWMKIYFCGATVMTSFSLLRTTLNE